MSAMVIFVRLFEVLELVPMIKESPDAVAIPDGPAELVFDDVDFSYPGAEEVSRWPRSRRWRGSTTRRAPTSCTTCRCPRRAGHRADGAGRPQWRGQDDDLDVGLAPLRRRPAARFHASTALLDVRDATTASLNAMVGVVTQDPHLFHDTLRSNLIFARPKATPRRGDRDGVARRPDLGVGAVAARLGLGGRWWASGAIAPGVVARSNGSRLARLLLKAPRLVVLDEATAHLDNESEAAVQRALDETMSSRTSLVIAHRLSTIRNADQILVVENGTIVQRGTHARAVRRGRCLPSPLRDAVRRPRGLMAQPIE